MSAAEKTSKREGRVAPSLVALRLGGAPFRAGPTKSLISILPSAPIPRAGRVCLGYAQGGQERGKAMLKFQLQVSADTGELEALYMWEENHPWQAEFNRHEAGWVASVSNEVAAENGEWSEYFLSEGAYPSLHTALKAYLASEWVCPTAKVTTAYGSFGLVLGG